MSDLPDFDSLPSVPGMPQGCAWGFLTKTAKKTVWAASTNSLRPSSPQQLQKSVMGFLFPSIGLSTG